MTDDAPSKGTPDRPDPARPAAVDNPDLTPPPGAFDSDPDLDRDVSRADAAGGPVDPEFPTRVSRAGVTGAAVALGTGLLGAAVVVSASRARWTEDGELDWSNFGIGLGATAVLLVVAVLAALAARRRSGGRAREEAITWPGAVGILATALMIGVGIDSDDNWVGYLIGGVIIALAVVGYLAARRAAFVVTGILGLGLVYLLLFDDLIAENIGDDHAVVVAAAVIAVFVLAVTVLGWLLPTRAVSGVAVGVIGVVGFVGLMAGMVIVRVLSGFFNEMPMFGTDGSGDGGMGFGLAETGYSEADVWWILAFAAVLTVVWALAAAVSNHSGFSILAIVMPTLLVPLATVALAAEHPSYWGAALAAGGGLLLLGGVLLSRLRSRKLESLLP